MIRLLVMIAKEKVSKVLFGFFIIIPSMYFSVPIQTKIL